jgi:hypothetical protein
VGRLDAALNPNIIFFFFRREWLSIKPTKTEESEESAVKTAQKVLSEARGRNELARWSTPRRMNRAFEGKLTEADERQQGCKLNLHDRDPLAFHIRPRVVHAQMLR